ncbi:MAG: hypothetical protein J1F31_05225 [Erysipelotrichales bacterium]|nr:hypothetical protein [Erysipelotrichales bacterium]
MIYLVKLTETDKRILITAFLAIILVFLLIGLVVNIVRKIMAHQGRAVDTYMYDMLKAKVVTTPREFRKISFIKNFQILYKKITLPIILLAIAFVICLIRYFITKDEFFVTYFTIEKGIGSLFYKWDWAEAEKATILNIKTFIPSNWPDALNTPHFESNVSSIMAYCSFPFLLVGLILYFNHLLAFISRSIQTRKLSKTFFQKDLSKVTNEI